MKEALALSSGAPITADRIAKLAELRSAFEELTEAYEGLRRMIERSYLTFKAE